MSIETGGQVTAQSYTLTEDGRWLGQVVITSDGMFSGVTDWGNMSFAWRAFGNDFKDFLLKINPDYFACKMANGAAYSFGSSKKIDKACELFANKILPALQKTLSIEMDAMIKERHKG